MTVAPAGCSRTAAVSWFGSLMARSLNFVTTSPTLMPALSAAEPGSTVATSAPTENPEAEVLADFALTLTPNWPCVALPLSMISWATRLALLIGMLKPTPMLPLLAAGVSAGRGDGDVDADDLALGVDQRAAGVAGVDGRVGLDDVDGDGSLVSGALALPAAGRSELEALVAALGIVGPVLGAAEDATLMVRFSVETMPSVTVPVRPSGEPMATAVSPTFSLPESPSVAGTARRRCPS